MFRYLLLALFVSLSVQAQTTTPSTNGLDENYVMGVMEKALANKWYEKIKFRGYAHFRYNRLLETNKDLNCTSCDRSIGDKQGFFFRRARWVFFGDVSDRVYVQLQADLVTAVGEQQGFLNLREAYFDYALVDDKSFRIRTGQSKVPWGFENLQSSGNRGAFDRTDAVNMAVPNEYDTGMYAMWAPAEIRARFKELANPVMKGSGDYGVLTGGIYNGQTMNRPEKNNDLHRVVRAAYPYKFDNGQILEPSLQYFEGKFNLLGKDYYENRTGASLVLYPKPLGFQAEWNTGMGPQYDPAQDKIRVLNTHGGYAQINYSTYYKDHRFFPYVRYQEYKGGKKLEDARYNQVREWEVGTEWQPNPVFELTVAYGISDRLTQGLASSTVAPGQRNHQTGNLMRFQAQFNY